MVILSQDEWCEEAIGLLSRYKEDELQLTVILQTGLLFSLACWREDVCDATCQNQALLPI